MLVTEGGLWFARVCASHRSTTFGAARACFPENPGPETQLLFLAETDDEQESSGAASEQVERRKVEPTWSPPPSRKLIW